MILCQVSVSRTPVHLPPALPGRCGLRPPAPPFAGQEPSEGRASGGCLGAVPSRAFPPGTQRGQAPRSLRPALSAGPASASRHRTQPPRAGLGSRLPGYAPSAGAQRGRRGLSLRAHDRQPCGLPTMAPPAYAPGPRNPTALRATGFQGPGCAHRKARPLFPRPPAAPPDVGLAG